MKKYAKAVVLLMLCLCLFWIKDSAKVQAASARSTYKKAITYYKKKKFTKANQVFRRLPRTVSDRKAGKLTAGMKRAYKRVVKSYRLDSGSLYSKKPLIWGYYLTDINKDKKPELLVKYGTCEADVRLRIYTYKNGRAKRVKTLYCSHSGFYYYPLGNGVLMLQGHMEYENLTLITMKNGRIKTKTLGQRQIKKSYVSPAYSLEGHISYSGGRRRIDLTPFK